VGINRWAPAGLALLGKVDEQMIEVTPVYEPTSNGKAENTYISKVCHPFPPPESLVQKFNYTPMSTSPASALCLPQTHVDILRKSGLIELLYEGSMQRSV